jgi:hypothetical protein
MVKKFNYKLNIIKKINSSKKLMKGKKSFLKEIENLENKNIFHRGTREFIEGVVKRINELTKNSIPIIDLNKIKEKIKLKKSQRKEEEVSALALEVVDLNSCENEIIEENKISEVDKINEVVNLSSNSENIDIDDDNHYEEEVKVISEKEFLENLANNENKINQEGAFSCGICYTTRVKIDTRMFDCGHEFCNKCATRWMKEHWNCPVCRASFTKW